MTGTLRRASALLAALLLLVVHVVLPGLPRFERVHEATAAHAEPAAPCWACHAAVVDEPAPREATHRHAHDHTDCALCIALLARGELLPCGHAALASRPAPSLPCVEPPALPESPARRPLPPPARAPPTA